MKVGNGNFYIIQFTFKNFEAKNSKGSKIYIFYL